MFPVVVVPYDPAWPGMFDGECTLLLKALDHLHPDIEHIRSTSVPGLAAKPKIDILVGLRAWGDLETAIKCLSGIGYEHEPQLSVPRHFSMKRGHPTTHRVHLVERRGDLWTDNLAFRDALRANPDLCAHYAEVKQGLAARHPNDHHAYSAGKAPLIEAVIERERSRTPRPAAGGRRERVHHLGPNVEPPAVIVDYDPTWPVVSDELRARLASALAGVATSIEHVGSTAVPGLAAKPIVDIDVVVSDGTVVPAAIERLKALGYVHQGDLGVTGREAFRPPGDGPYHHLYVVVQGSPPHRDHIDLRDYLRRRPDEVARYAERKRELAHLLTTDRHAYVDAKSGIIRDMLSRARSPA